MVGVERFKKEVIMCDETDCKQIHDKFVADFHLMPLVHMFLAVDPTDDCNSREMLQFFSPASKCLFALHSRSGSY